MIPCGARRSERRRNMRAVRLKTERMVNPLGIDVRHPDLSWICDGGVRQSAYRIIAEELSGKKGAENRKVIWDSGKISSSAMQVRFPEELESRQRIGWKVHLYVKFCSIWKECFYFSAVNSAIFCDYLFNKLLHTCFHLVYL